MADRLICCYGPSGAAKTSYLIELIKMVYEATGKGARVYVGDGSKANYLDSGLVEAGILQVWDYSNHPWPMTTSQQMCEGWWPEDPEDPQSKLKKPTPQELAAIGCWGFEGLSVMMKYVMGNIKGGLAEQAGRGIKIGQDSPIQIMDSDVKAWNTDKYGNQTPVYDEKTGTGVKFGGNPIAHFNVAQVHAQGLIQRTAALPGWVMWTAHEKLGQEAKGDKDNRVIVGDTIIGPEVAGNALSPSISRSFNETIHATIALGSKAAADDLTKRQVTEMVPEYRLYTRDHHDPDGIVRIPYRAVIRCPKPDKVPLFLSSKVPGQSIRKLYELIHEAKLESQREVEALKAKRAQQPVVA